MIKKAKPPGNRYNVFFDEAINTRPLILDNKSIELLDEFREGIHTLPLYDATQAAAIQLQANAFQKSTKNGGEIKQINNLLDIEIIGRDIDFKNYGFCHHCKQIKPISCLYKCSETNATSKIKCNHANLAYKSRNFLLSKLGRKYDQRSPIKKGTQKENIKEIKGSCERLFCFVCMSLNYDTTSKELDGNISWKCPFCQVLNAIFNFSVLASVAGV